MLIKIILNIDAIPGDTNLTMSNSFTILHLFWNVYFKKHVSGILPREDPSIVLGVSNRISLPLDSCFKTKLKYPFFLLKKALRGQ